MRKNWQLSRIKHSKVEFTIRFCDGYSSCTVSTRSQHSAPPVRGASTVASFCPVAIEIRQAVAASIHSVFSTYYIFLGTNDGSQDIWRILRYKPSVISVSFWAINAYNKIVSKL